MGVWQISEEESYFSEEVKTQYPISNSLKRLQHLAGRFLLQYIKADFPLHEVIGESGRKPYLSSGKYQFSVSHSGNYVSVLLEQNVPTGIDLEKKSGKAFAIWTKYLTEKEFLLQENSILLVEDFCTLCWTVKETVFKWYGRGEVDFKKHIQIHSISFDGNQFSADVLFNKQSVALKVKGFVFEDYIVSYIIKEFSDF